MEIQDLLGRPIHSPEIKEFLAKYHLPQNPNPEYDAYGTCFGYELIMKKRPFAASLLGM